MPALIFDLLLHFGFCKSNCLLQQNDTLPCAIYEIHHFKLQCKAACPNRHFFKAPHVCALNTFGSAAYVCAPNTILAHRMRLLCLVHQLCQGMEEVMKECTRLSNGGLGDHAKCLSIPILCRTVKHCMQTYLEIFRPHTFISASEPDVCDSLYCLTQTPDRRRLQQ